MTMHGRWRFGVIAGLLMLAAQADGQELLWETYVAAGNIALQQSRFADAERLYMLSVQQAEQLGKHDVRLAESLNSLAVVDAKQGKYLEAELLFQRSIEISEKALGAEHPNVVATIGNLGTLYAEQGKFTVAEPLLTRSLSLNIKILGRDHPVVATNLRVLALIYAKTGNYVDAERLIRLSVKIAENTLGVDHPEVAERLDELAVVLRHSRQNTEARQVESRAQQIRQQHARAHSAP